MAGDELDEKKSKAFAARLTDILNSGALSLMTSIGHRTGLFDTMATLSPSTSQGIATEAGLNERYVREWLGAMVTGGFIEYEPSHETYRLPPEHAAWVTRGASPNNIASFSQYISLLGTVEDRIVECFHKGGGVPYEAFPRFQAVMAEDSGQSVVPALESDILPLVPGLVDALCQGIDVLDVGCGWGRALAAMATAYPNSRFVGYELSPETTKVGIAEAERLGLTNLRFEVKDVTNLGVTSRFDLITAFDAIHDQAYPRKVLKGIADALRSNGTFLMQDIAGSSYLQNNMDHPIGSFLYTISCMHCMTVSLAAGGEGLGTMWGTELAQDLLREAGFTNVEVKHLPHDIQNAYYIVRKT
ncbi:MAG: class I SAM-dependent methyltransferase [Chloroflexi bacterium]|nr:class I SAM-dependent methyltransferase [Chloroflexota bacterium]